jgi:cytochrome b involved in lipid metabolism
MSAKNIIGTLVLVVFVGGILFVVTNKSNPNVLNQSSETVPTEQVNTATSLETSNSEGKATDTTQPSTPTSYTLTQVSTHAGATSCWTAIDGSVYDLTEWIGKHPGGERAILSICGKDGTAVFSGKHGMNGKQANILTGFKIGMLSN